MNGPRSSRGVRGKRRLLTLRVLAWVGGILLLFDTSYRLLRKAQRAFERSRFERAAMFADKLLEVASRQEKKWSYGNSVHHAHRILGLVALENGNREEAASHLLDSARIPGSPQLNTFGPNMQLAKALLEAGETEPVLVFFSLCRSFWRADHGRLRAWSEEVREGRVPDFGANLVYGTR